MKAERTGEGLPSRDASGSDSGMNLVGWGTERRVGLTDIAEES